MYMIPIANKPNHRFRCMVPVDDDNESFEFFLHYNQVAGYWVMDICDEDDKPLATGIPLLTGQYPAANLLEQYAHLGIGAAVIVPVGIAEGEPNADNLGKNFVLVWSDTL